MFNCIESDMYLFGQSNSPSPQKRNRVVTPSSSQSDEPIYIYDSDTDSTATIDNDPDSRYYLDDQEEVVDITGPDTRNLAGANSSETEQAEDDREIVDLTTADFNFDEGDYLTDDHFTWLLRNWNESSEQTTSAPEPEPQQPEKRILPDACVDGIIYRAGQSAELHDGSFLRIHAVLEDDSGEIFFRGPRLFKITDGSIDTCIPIWPNEVLWVIKKDINEDVPFHLIKHFCVVHFTNWPISIGDTARHGGLFCRLKQTVISGRQGAEEGSVEFLTPDEADDGFKYPPTLLRQIWRGTTQPFGDAEIRMSQPSQVIDLEGDSMVIDLTEPEGRTDQQRQQRRYTFGDGFCGAGGVSRGAKTAGLEIKWAFDKGAHAMNSYRLNFSTASCEQTDIFTFLTNDSKYLRVDVSHGSPPCQTFSPAHTVESANDDANSACIFSCADLIRKAKPRIHTMEETCGLSERHTATFFSVVQGFVEIGYSVRWKVMNCMDYGVPQSRRRLIIIASGPGEKLPPFPKPTHGLPGSGLLPYTTIRAMISNIPITAADHDIQGALDRGYRNGYRASFDGNQQARTITCSGGERNYHPSGRRGFTNREFACLQTFPLEHLFGPKEVRKQIGNAVPPVLAKAIYREIIKSLRKTDEEELMSEQEDVLIEI